MAKLQYGVLVIVSAIGLRENDLFSKKKKNEPPHEILVMLGMPQQPML